MPDQAYLKVEGISKRFGTGENTVAALDEVSFTLQKGRFLSILGPSGCGKSTLFNIIAGLMQPDTGAVTLQGESLIGRPGLTGYMLQRALKAGDAHKAQSVIDTMILITVPIGLFSILFAYLIAPGYIWQVVTPEEIKAKFEDGVLTLEVPKKDQEALPHKTTIMIE